MAYRFGPDDDLDAMLADIDSTIAKLDGPKKQPPLKSKPFMQSNPNSLIPRTLGDDEKMPIIHTKDAALAVKCQVPMSYQEFMTRLAAVAPYFTFDRDKDYLTPVHLWTYQGCAFTPLTAVALCMLKKHFNLAVSVFAGQAIGLSESDSFEIHMASLAALSNRRIQVREELFTAMYTNVIKE